MLIELPTQVELQKIMGKNVFKAWNDICSYIAENYNLVTICKRGGIQGIYEYKFQKDGKNLCTIYVKNRCFEIRLGLGKKEQITFQLDRSSFSNEVLEIFDNTANRHNGKLLVLEITDMAILEDIKRLFLLKKEPRRKATVRNTLMEI